MLPKTLKNTNLRHEGENQAAERERYQIFEHSFQQAMMKYNAAKERQIREQQARESSGFLTFLY